MSKKIKRRYNATYRARKKGVKIITSQKTCFLKSAENIPAEVLLLRREYDFGIQITML